MREAEASAFVAANRGTGVCISYLRDSEGNVRFADSEPGAEDAPARVIPAPPIVPLDRLRHPAVRRAAAVAALALAACTPHGEHDEPYVESVDEVVMERISPEIPLAEEPSELPPVAQEVVEVVEAVEEEEKPCEPETKTDPETTPERTKPRRGRLKRPNKAADFDRIDGGI